MIRTYQRFVAALATGCLALSTFAAHDIVDQFDDGDVGSIPPHWFVPPMLEQQGVRAVLTDNDPYKGERCLQLDGPAGNGVANVMRIIDATPYRDHRVTLTAAVRVAPPARAQLWFRVDCEDGRRGFFDNMGDQPIRGDEWDEYTITGNVSDDAVAINVGLMLPQGGTGWIDSVSIIPVGRVVRQDDPARHLTDRGLTNLTALTRLLGYVRYFHPSDEATEMDWAAWTIHAVRQVEDVESDAALAAALTQWIEPIAPTVRIMQGEKPDPDPGRLRPDDDEPNQIVRWRHFGVGSHVPPDQGRGPYRSQRTFDSFSEVKDDARPLIVRRELAPGIWCELPIDLYATDDRTLPRAEGDLDPRADWPEFWTPSPRDRATRLADVMVAWTVMQHFYPYFDTVETDWDQALADALLAAAKREGERPHLHTLRELIARLHDGHGMVWHTSAFQPNVLPLLKDWVDDELVITAVRKDETDLAAGDVVLAIDGREVGDIYNELATRISGATEQWIRYSALRSLRTEWPTENPANLTIRRADGTQANVAVHRMSMERVLLEEPSLHDDPNRPDNGSELAPGIIYINLDRLDQYQHLLPAMRNAGGIIFDLRGYPGGAGAAVMHHLTRERITSPQWHVPEVQLPDREDMTFRRMPGWQIHPREPYLDAELVFLTDGRAISYAESCLGIVEHYALGEIVGSPTAGTNGNVNPFTVPGDYSIIWTGMKVLKHDGSQHHGIGILPTVPVTRTIEGIREGRDELLDKAIEVLQEKLNGTVNPPN